MINKESSIKMISYLLTFTLIIVIIPLHLFPCFISGLLSYEIIISLATIFEKIVGSEKAKARWLVVAFISTIVVSSMTLGIISLITFLEDFQKKIDLITEINRIFNDVKKHVPIFLPSWLPNSTEELKDQIFIFIESNLIFIRNMGHTFLHGLITLFIGLIIGTVIALSKPTTTKHTYFISQLLQRIHHLSNAFHNIVFAQIKISLINTLFTSIIIFIIFPLIFNDKLPLSKTLTLTTFIFGLLPIVGNIMSNIIITISALSISLIAGGMMLVYLILIHKLEYFLNAEIIGNRIKAQPWELMLVMLLFESIFGLEGIIAAPIYYAYLKTELRAHNLI
ncbi:AI-2E family transporter [Blochmannia endosymbiont of Polyrhachis (Hedomyrma) turneri]|uniref:AI-2E family transporter n=1 Tax=Blochmannia endosymbiont of Polyrhachis (Hedomyrma) turneri TaxID=1505596 RepID=UPI00061A5268|nr:AI-2E family transporter [Blochmannia endosymbiont of Polyrhachis (Hedomyrma) turneri]AKC59616.1 putative transmembrane protein [Blochmannia endosymbiont of Polyrhachis (Hedomyrma) turneri]